MKVKDVLAIREKKQKEFENLQKLEKLFCNNKELAEEIADMAGGDIPLYMLFTEARMAYFEDINDIDEKIGNLEVPFGKEKVL